MAITILEATRKVLKSKQTKKTQRIYDERKLIKCCGYTV